MRQLIIGGIAMAMAITANAAELTAKENAIINIALEVPGTEQSNEWCEPVDDKAYAALCD